MTKRCFPDVNVWFALVVADHPHNAAAMDWWNEDACLAGFCRLTQLGLLRLLTTASAMGGRPLTNAAAWSVYDTFLSDDRVQVFSELPAIEERFRALSTVRRASPKIWADTYLAAYAVANDAVLVTFDQAFAHYDVPCRMLA